MDKSAQAKLLKECRRELGMSVKEFQLMLCFRDERIVRRLEAGEIDIHGSTWVALMYVLDEEGHEDLADRVFSIIENLRDEADEKLAAKWAQWEEKKRRRSQESVDIRSDLD